MKRSTFAVFGVAAMVLVFGTTAQADTLWGVTNGTNENFYTGGQIFTVDTATGSVSVKASYGTSTVLAFGDIAVRNNGEVYVTYYGQDGFDKLAKVNTSTWGFDWVQDLGVWNDLAVSTAGGVPTGPGFQSESEIPEQAPFRSVVVHDTAPVGSVRFIRLQVERLP